MENLRLLLVITVLCAVLSDGLAQNRGSSRYSPADEEFDGPTTPPQRSPPSRRASVRRRKPTPAPEPTEINKELPDYQLPKREGTTARRVPSRVPAEEFAPHIPDVPVLPDEPILPAVVDELPQITTTAPEDKPQGRRRRPKKRRRPQNGASKPAANAEKLDVIEPEKSRVPVNVPELLDVDQKRPEPFSVNPELISNPNKFDSPAGLEEKPLWSDDKLVNTGSDSDRRNPEPAPYYPPQVGTNRLPIEDTERIESARGLPEPTPPAYLDIPNKRYSHPVDEPPSRASYVPVLTPIRVPTESRSRASEKDFPETRNQESTRRSRPSDRRGPQRTTSNRTPSIPLPEANDERTTTGARAPQNLIPHNSRPNIPEKALPEVRLPATEPPLFANEFTDKPAFETAEELLERLQEEGNPAVEGIELQGPDAASRLPNPGDAPYDDVYSPYSENIGSEERSADADAVPHRREEDIPLAPRPSFNDIQPQETPKRQNTNNVDTDGRQISRYEPPLQRGGFRSRGSERSESARTASEDNSRTQVPTRGRGSSRYQPEAAPEEFSRTRSTSRSSSDSSSNTPTRTRSSQSPSQAPTRSRNTQRYQPDPAESRARVSARRQPVDSEYAEERPVDVDYRRRAPAPAHEEDSQYVPPPPRSAPVNVPDEEYIPVRSAARPRPPQYEARDTPEPYLHEELSEDQPDPNAYAPEYEAPRQPSRRRPEDQRGTSLREQPVGQRGPPLREQVVDQRRPPVREQPERQVPRQTSRRENAGQRNAARQPQPDYRAPEENTRYQAPPQNSRNQARPVPQRDLNHGRHSASSQPSRARQSESSQSQSQSRAPGSSKFTCPEAFGFFADPVQCDKYYECRNGTAVENLCADGLAFNEIGAPKFLRCDSYRDVDCSSRPELQEAKPTKNCPRKYGLYPDESDCTKFFNCVDGAATQVQCPPGLTFNDDRATCDWADLVKSSCKTEDLLGFTCPEPNAHDLVDGVYTTYPHPDNCQLHFFCIKGEDGLRRPRLLTCHEGLVYNPTTKTCARPEEVPGCEEFYGSRSPPPKTQRKPAREPIREPIREPAREPIEPEEYEEPPTPKPRRRVQHRRQRN